MAWIYYQSSGKLFHGQEFIGQGYSVIAGIPLMLTKLMLSIYKTMAPFR